MVVHSLGALWGFVRSVRTFEVTEKVTPEYVETVHDDLGAHDGAGRLLRDSDETFSEAVSDD